MRRALARKAVRALTSTRLRGLARLRRLHDPAEAGERPAHWGQDRLCAVQQDLRAEAAARESVA